VKLRRPLPPAYADRTSLDVDGTERTYWVAPEPGDAGGTPPTSGPRPLILGFHGSGSTGSRLAWWSGLGTQGPPAGFHCVFPDALDMIWDDHGCGRRDGADDIAFTRALIDHLVATGQADPERVFVTGLSTGATFAERLVRGAYTEVAGLALITGTARVANTETTAIRGRPTPILLMAGTADPITPYDGGLPRGSMGRAAMRNMRRVLVDPSGHESVAPEVLAADWARSNGCSSEPRIDVLERPYGTIPVQRMTWTGTDVSSAPVVMYRMDGGGHGWPGGKQYLPAKLIGRIPQHFDATGIVLDFARDAGRWRQDPNQVGPSA
jgi:polyhydroxybutyrate depolymerase